MTPAPRNVRRMPFAEWLYRMAEDGLPYQARALAVYAVAFRISGNEELLEMSGIGERTYDKWKKRLLADGWVIISRRNGGRGIGIEVSPALREVPVEFTDLRARNPRSFCQNQQAQPDGENPAIFDNEEEEIAGVKNTGADRAVAEITPAINSENPAIVAQTAELTGANFVQNAEVAEVSEPSRVRPRATKESPTEIVIYSTDSPLPPEVQAVSNHGEGEEDRVVVNCVSIKGPNFTIDLRSIDMAASLVGMPIERGRMIAEMYAREWAANNSRPNHPMAYLKKMIAADKNDAAIAEVRLSKAQSFNGVGRQDAPAEPVVDRTERIKRRAAEQLAKQQKGTTQ